MSDEPFLVGCLSATLTPHAPSEEVPCAKCGTPVWISHQMLDYHLSLGAAGGKLTPLCVMTCLVVPEGTQLTLPDEQREYLRKQGLTDADIARGALLAELTVMREEPDQGETE